MNTSNTLSVTGLDLRIAFPISVNNSFFYDSLIVLYSQPGKVYLAKPSYGVLNVVMLPLSCTMTELLRSQTCEQACVPLNWVALRSSAEVFTSPSTWIAQPNSHSNNRTRHKKESFKAHSTSSQK